MEVRHVEEARFREDIVSALKRVRYAEKVRGDDLLKVYDATEGDRQLEAVEASLAEQIAANFDGGPVELYRAVKHAVPSAKPSRMDLPQGMRHHEARSWLRSGDIQNFGTKRLLAIAGALDCEIVVTLRRKRGARRRKAT